jgi:PAS domain S-box-containing protein
VSFNKNKLPFFKVEGYHCPSIQSMNFYNFAIEMAADEVFLMKSDSQIIYVNDSACKRLGYRRSELTGKYVWEWDPLFSKEDWVEFWKEFVTAKHVHLESKHRSKDGAVYPVDIHVYTYAANNEIFALAFVNDLSEKQMYIKELQSAQRELLKYQEDLEKQVESRTKELSEQNNLIEAIHNLQSRFITQPDPFNICQEMFINLKKLTDSKSGFVGEVYTTPEGDHYIIAYVINIQTRKNKSRKQCIAPKEKRLKYHRLDTLFGHDISDREVVMSNDPMNDNRNYGLPNGHLPINNFLGIPVLHGDKLVGEIGLANRKGGYDQKLLDYIKPLVSAHP